MPVALTHMTASSNSGANPPANTPTTPAASCPACAEPLSGSARFCHHCGAAVGHAVGHSATTIAPARANASILPWAVTFVVLLSVVALLAGRNFGGTFKGNAAPAADSLTPPANGIGPTADPTADASADASASGRAPDIASMSPEERASRLYVRVMAYAEDGKVDSIARFAPMVLAAHEMLTSPTLDERYHFGRVAEVVGSGTITSAQADTILKQSPRSLLGLLLAARGARLEANQAKAKGFDLRLLAALEAELATRNQDYENHRAEIDRAVADARRPN